MPATVPGQSPPLGGNAPGDKSESSAPMNHPHQASLERPDQEKELDLTVHFLGCPSISTSVSLPVPATRDDHCYHSGSVVDDGDEVDAVSGDYRTDAGPSRGIETRLASRDARSLRALLWGFSRGRNNNRAFLERSNAEGDGEVHVADSQEDGVRVLDETAHDDGEHLNQSVEDSESEETEEGQDVKYDDDGSDDDGHESSESVNSHSLRREDTTGMPANAEPRVNACNYQAARGCRRLSGVDINSDGDTLTSDSAGGGVTGPAPRKSTGSLSAYGRAILSRMNRSPYRNSSPSKRKGDQGKGWSAPVPTPVQSSTGFTNISRPSSTSPNRRGGHRSPARPDPGAKPALYLTSQHDDVPPVGGATDSRYSLLGRLPSSSPGAPDIHRVSCLAPSAPLPAPSVAESDLRQSTIMGSQAHQQYQQHQEHQHQHPLPQHQPAVQKPPHPQVGRDQNFPCRLILPDEAWSPRAPHGDIQQMAPRKMLEMTCKALRDQHHQFQESQQGQRMAHHQHSTHPPNPASPASEPGISPITSMSPSGTPSSVAKPQAAVGATVTTHPEDVACQEEGVVARPRSSRRHPVLDKMFRHILASLVHESGPPSSACLASVLERGGAWPCKGSHSGLGSASTTNAMTNSGAGVNRCGVSLMSAAGGGTSGSADLTLSFSSALTCTLSKVNEEVTCSCPANQGEVTVTTADAC